MILPGNMGLKHSNGTTILFFIPGNKIIPEKKVFSPLKMQNQVSIFTLIPGGTKSGALHIDYLKIFITKKLFYGN